METNACGREGGSSLKVIVLPPVSPRFAMSVPSEATTAMLGGRLGTAIWSIGGSFMAW
jgi:hypothetical protein